MELEVPHTAGDHRSKRCKAINISGEMENGSAHTVDLYEARIFCQEKRPHN
jgi:hypothetical protein